MINLTKRALNSMRLLIFTGAIIGSASHGDVHLSNAQIQSFNLKEVDADTELCKKLAPSTGIEFQTWILDELKKQGYAEAKVENIKTEDWVSTVNELKADGENLSATWVKGSVGTQGSLNGKDITDTGENGKVQGVIFDVGKGVESDVKKLKEGPSKNPVGAWLIERTEVIPLYALAIQAKANSAAALFVYAKGDRKLKGDDLLQNKIYPLPIFNVDYNTAQILIKKAKVKAVSFSLSLRTMFPVSKNQATIMVRARSRDYGLVVSAGRDDCREIGVMLGLTNWLKENKLTVTSTNFVFVDSKLKLDTPAVFGLHFQNLALIEKGEFAPKNFFTRWFSADAFPSRLISNSDINRRVEKLAKELKGLVDGDELMKYASMMKRVQVMSGSGKAAIAFRLDEVYGEGNIAKAADEIRTLREIYTSAQRGLWQKAQNQSTKLAGFNWASQVSRATFTEFQKAELSQGKGVDPQVWLLLQKGKPAADDLLKLIESEIDRLTQKVTENFTKLEKDVEEMPKPGG